MSEDRLEAMMGLVNKTAMEVLALPPLEREPLLQRLRAENERGALSLGNPPAIAKEMADGLDGFVRDMIRLIESTGGGAGGQA